MSVPFGPPLNFPTMDAKRTIALLLAGGERLEIIHGVGTGALRDAVRRRLRELSEVREVRDADTPGRDGVTIALL
jgi:dsDNA-specific endonuclease/ATPase MutS2